MDVSCRASRLRPADKPAVVDKFRSKSYSMSISKIENLASNFTKSSKEKSSN
ncbi:hypothetical protein FRC03_001438 [Tulasnella sp. 419]|nr:hypothetical protein FRC03_001438 [Tulasnella sp. 419]